MTSSLLTTDDTHASAVAVDVDLLLDLPDKSDGPFLPPVQMPSGGDTSSSSVLQEELLAQLAQKTGKLRRDVEHFSGALVADQGDARSGEGAREHGSDEAGACVAARSPWKSTWNDVSDNAERRRHDQRFSYALCHAVQMRRWGLAVGFVMSQSVSLSYSYGS